MGYLDKDTDVVSNVLSKRLNNGKLKGEYLFPGRIPIGMKPEDAGPIVKVNAAQTAAVKRSKVAPFRMYDLRHTWATRAAQDGVDLVTSRPCWAIAGSIWSCATLTQPKNINSQHWKSVNATWQSSFGHLGHSITQARCLN